MAKITYGEEAMHRGCSINAKIVQALESNDHEWITGQIANGIAEEHYWWSYYSKEGHFVPGYWLQCGLSPNIVHPVTGESALMTALRDREVDFIDMLVKHGGQTSSEEWLLLSEEYKTQLNELSTKYVEHHHKWVGRFLEACMNGDMQTVKAAVNEVPLHRLKSTQDEGYHTGLDFAIMAYDLNIVRVLLTLGFPVDNRDIDGNTPLHLAAQWYAFLLQEQPSNDAAVQLQDERAHALRDIMQLLIHSGADLEARNFRYGKRVIDYLLEIGLISDEAVIVDQCPRPAIADGAYLPRSASVAVVGLSRAEAIERSLSERGLRRVDSSRSYANMMIDPETGLVVEGPTVSCDEEHEMVMQWAKELAEMDIPGAVERGCDTNETDMSGLSRTESMSSGSDSTLNGLIVDMSTTIDVNTASGSSTTHTNVINSLGYESAVSDVSDNCISMAKATVSFKGKGSSEMCDSFVHRVVSSDRTGRSIA